MFASRFAWVLLVAGALASAGQVSRPSPVRLFYERAPGTEACPDAETISNAVAARLGYQAFDDSAPESIRVTIRTARSGLVASMEKRDAQGALLGQRELSSPRLDCVDLSTAVSFAVSVAIDPLSLSRPAPVVAPEPVDAGQAEPVVDAGAPITPPPPPPDAGSNVEPVAPAPAVLGLGLAVFGTAGATPAVSGGGLLRFRARWPLFSLALEARADVPGAVSFSGGRISAAPYLVTLAPCAHFRWMAACGVVSGGILRSAGDGLSASTSQLTPLVSLGLRLQGDWALTESVSLEPFLSAEVPLVPTILTVSGTPVWTTSVAGSLGLALTMRIR